MKRWYVFSSSPTVRDADKCERTARRIYGADDVRRERVADPDGRSIYLLWARPAPEFKRKRKEQK